MHTLKKDVDGVIDVLHRHDKPLFCPYKPTLLVPGRLSNELQMHREPCASWCPHFDHQQKSGWLYLTCGRVTTPIEIKPQVEIKEPSKLTLI